MDTYARIQAQTYTSRVHTHAYIYTCLNPYVKLNIYEKIYNYDFDYFDLHIYICVCLCVCGGETLSLCVCIVCADDCVCVCVIHI